MGDTYVTGINRGGMAWVPQFVQGIDRDRCIGCGRCFKVCGRDVFELLSYTDEEDTEKMVMTVAVGENCGLCQGLSQGLPRPRPGPGDGVGGGAEMVEMEGAAEEHLRRAAAADHRSDEARQHLLRALEGAPDRLEVHVACYRFHFYRNDLQAALSFAERCLALSARRLGLPEDWRQVRPGDAAFHDHPLARFFLHALKAYGYICLRLGRNAEARTALAKLMGLDPADRFGGHFLLTMAENGGPDHDQNP